VHDWLRISHFEWKSTFEAEKSSEQREADLDDVIPAKLLIFKDGIRVTQMTKDDDPKPIIRGSFIIESSFESIR
jgi:hypothetical protein